MAVSFVDKIMPTNIDAEEAILGGILIDPIAINRVANILRPEALAITVHQHIYRAALALHSKEQPTDLMNVTTFLDDHNLLEVVGGQTKLVMLVDRTVSAVNIDQYALLVVDKFVRRELIKVGNELVQLGYETSTELDAILNEAEQKIFVLNKYKEERQKAIRPLSEYCHELWRYLDEIEEQRLETANYCPGISTGFYDLDDLLGGGFYRGELIVIGGRPGSGKTALACALGYNIASLPTNGRVLMFSMEMPGRDLAARLMALESGVSVKDIRKVNLAGKYEVLASALGKVSDADFWIDESLEPSPLEIRSRVREFVCERGPLGLVIVDYLQLMVNSADENVVNKISEITRQMKILAREVDAPVLLLSQLNRGVETRTNKRPSLSDLRGSGGIEQDADVVLGVYRDDYYNPDSPDRGMAEIIGLKGRNSGTGTVKLLFDAECCRFRNIYKLR
ncbi:replicative DNA helicase [Microcoleus sp. C2C3]|uniref:replicative DNA helicase n=1 Tax=unclassified Microcoleus TaxID=2642155 RepID=UPI002FD6B1BD